MAHHDGRKHHPLHSKELKDTEAHTRQGALEDWIGEWVRVGTSNFGLQGILRSFSTKAAPRKADETYITLSEADCPPMGGGDGSDTLRQVVDEPDIAFFIGRRHWRSFVMV